MDGKYRERKMKKCFGWTFSPSKLPNKQITRFIHITKLSHKEGMTWKTHSEESRNIILWQIKHAWVNIWTVPDKKLWNYQRVNNESQEELFGGKYCNVSRIITYTLEILIFFVPIFGNILLFCGLYAWNESFNGDAKFQCEYSLTSFWKGTQTSPFSDNWVVSIKFMHHMTNAETIIELAIQREIFRVKKYPENFHSFISKRLFKHQQSLEFVIFPS